MIMFELRIINSYTSLSRLDFKVNGGSTLHTYSILENYIKKICDLFTRRMSQFYLLYVLFQNSV